MDNIGVPEKLANPVKTALNEKDAKDFLKSYGIPVVNETTVTDVLQAGQAALEIGFPVVLKGLGAGLMHKTERGLVHLNLVDADAVRRAARLIARAAGDALEGFLVQPHLSGKREFVAGLFRDAQFGPVVMFGLGGVLAEALSDVTFRLAPIDESDALEMLTEIKARSLLDDFRGEKAVDRSQLTAALMGLSRIALSHPEIAEIDINPLLTTPSGQVWAVDALVVNSATKPKNMAPLPVSADLIGKLFYPKSIAFVGASAEMGKWGHMLFTLTRSGGYNGPIYLVNHKGGSIAGQTVFRSVAEIPQSVDLAVVTVPASAVLDLIPQFEQKGIKNMLLITSGFSETGAAGRQLEQSLVHAARRAGILVLGPNTMGICNPHIDLYCTGSHVRPRPGSTAVVAQSGNMGTQLLAFAERQGIGIRGFSGSGNEAMITIEDYLDAFEGDNQTQTVILYVESVKNGLRFFESARRVGRKKPIVLLKGGQSTAGSRAAASHTGALTSDIRVFDAMCRQAGIVKVEQPMDLLDLAAAFSSLPLPKNNRVAIMTLGGGWGVVTADLCAHYGLELPSLTAGIVSRFDAILPFYWSKSNPVDIVGERDTSIPVIVLEELLKWDGCDAVINLGILGRRILLERQADSVSKADPTYSKQFLESVKSSFKDFETEYVAHMINLMEKYHKPVFGVSLLTDEKDQTVFCIDDSEFKAVAYATPERAVKALAKMYEYQRFLTREHTK